MPKLYLVRHGKAAAGFGEEADPGLDETGRAQAEAVCAALSERGPLPILTSPLRRCRETAEPLASAWGSAPEILEAVREVPSPSDDLKERGEWLRVFVTNTWPEVEPGVQRWRETLLAALKGIGADSVIFTHFVPINTVVGAAMGTERVVNFKPGNGSVTILQADARTLTVLDLGDEAETEIR